MEEWKEIKGYENYFVSNFGNVKHNDKIKSQFNNRGYKCVDLYKNNQRKHFKVHKLVYMTFIGEYNCKLDINNIDGNKENNNINNLEVCTRKENLEHAVRLGLNKQSIKITAIKNGEKIKSYSIGSMYKLLKEKENINCKEKTFKESVRRALNTGSIYYGYSFVRGW